MAGLSSRFSAALLSFAASCRCSPASPSDEGGLDEVTEFCSRRPSCRSRSAICFLGFGNLLFGFRDLLFSFCQFLVTLYQLPPQILVLTDQTFVLTFQPSLIALRWIMFAAANKLDVLKPSNIYTARFFSKYPGLSLRFFKASCYFVYAEG